MDHLSQQPGPPTSWVFFKKLPRKEARPGLQRAQLSRVCGAYGKVQDIIVLHGRGSALVQFQCPAAAERLLATCQNRSSSPFEEEGWPNQLEVRRGNNHREKVVWDPNDPDMHRREVARCVEALVRATCTTYAQQRRQARQLRRQQHKQLLKVLEEEQAAVPQAGDQLGNAVVVRQDICWDYVRRNGNCPRGAACRYRHEMVPVTQLPARLRVFLAEDTFPVTREAAEEKAAVNKCLVELSRHLSNKRCLLLDGASGNSVKAVRGCPVQQRSPEDIVVPNNCTDTYLAIKRGEECRGFYGSLRAFLEHNAAGPRERFGLVYLDYCCRLRAGYKHIEKSPVGDIQCLFETRTCDPEGCVLAVCLCQEGEESSLDAPQALRSLVCAHAAKQGLAAVPHWCRFSYAGNFVEVFRLCKYQNATSLLPPNELFGLEDLNEAGVAENG